MEFDPNFSQGPSQGKEKENPEGTRMILTNHSSRIVYVSMILSTPIFTQIFYTDEAYYPHNSSTLSSTDVEKREQANFISYADPRTVLSFFSTITCIITFAGRFSLVPVLFSARDKPRGQDSRDSCLVPSRSPSLLG